jgi:hypothetical protein
VGRFGTQAHRPRQHRTVSAYWVHHPTEGDYLIDAGLARAFGRKGGNYTALLRLILVLIIHRITCRTWSMPGPDHR